MCDNSLDDLNIYQTCHRGALIGEGKGGSMKIVSDSSVMFSVAEGAKRGMTILPLSVAIGDESWLEYEEITADEFLKRVRGGDIPQSASPPVAATLAAYDTDEEIVHLAMASGLSGTYDSACGLHDQARHPERVHIFNTRTLCVPHRIMALTAVHMAERGFDAQAILAKMEEMASTAYSYLLPEDFDFLRRGGRLTPLAAKFVSLIKANPTLVQTEDGRKLEKLKIARGLKKAIDAVMDDLERRGVRKGYYISISHADNLPHAQKTSEWLRERFPECEIGIFDLGPAFITQGGPGCFAVQAIDASLYPEVAIS